MCRFTARSPDTEGYNDVSIVQKFSGTEDGKAVYSNDDRRNGSCAILICFLTPSGGGTEGEGRSRRTIDQTEPLVFPGFCAAPS